MYPNRDPLGIFLGPTEEGVMKAMRLPTRRAALLLRQGLTRTCVHDGLPFFSTSHKVNPADPKNPAFSRTTSPTSRSPKTDGPISSTSTSRSSAPTTT